MGALFSVAHNRDSTGFIIVQRHEGEETRNRTTKRFAFGVLIARFKRGGVVAKTLSFFWHGSACGSAHLDGGHKTCQLGQLRS